MVRSFLARAVLFIGLTGAAAFPLAAHADLTSGTTTSAASTTGSGKGTGSTGSGSTSTGTGSGGSGGSGDGSSGGCSVSPTQAAGAMGLAALPAFALVMFSRRRRR